MIGLGFCIKVHAPKFTSLISSPPRTGIDDDCNSILWDPCTPLVDRTGTNDRQRQLLSWMTMVVVAVHASGKIGHHTRPVCPSPLLARFCSKLGLSRMGCWTRMLSSFCLARLDILIKTRFFLSQEMVLLLSLNPKNSVHRLIVGGGCQL